MMAAVSAAVVGAVPGLWQQAWCWHCLDCWPRSMASNLHSFSTPAPLRQPLLLNINSHPCVPLIHFAQHLCCRSAAASARVPRPGGEAFTGIWPAIGLQAPVRCSQAHEGYSGSAHLSPVWLLRQCQLLAMGRGHRAPAADLRSSCRPAAAACGRECG